MADFQPFRALRFVGDPSHGLSRVLCPPYDVIDEAERRDLDALDPHNTIRLILPAATDKLDAYHHAGDLFEQWRRQRVLVHDAQPTFSRYEMRYTDDLGRARHTLGVVGALELTPSDGSVLPHERTHSKAKGDRLDLMRATHANLEPIWGLSTANGLSQVLRSLDLDNHEQVATIDGIEHRVAPITDPRHIDAIRSIVESRPVVLADGHHRYETAAAFRDEIASRADAEPALQRAARSIMIWIVQLDEDEISAGAIHREFHGPSLEHLSAALARDLALENVGPVADFTSAKVAAAMAASDGFALVFAGYVHLARLTNVGRQRMIDEVPASLVGIDAAAFETLVAPHLVGTEITYEHQPARLLERARDGRITGAAVLRPVSVADIRTVAEARERMPQKTTFFRPKPCSGIVFRSLTAD